MHYLRLDRRKGPSQSHFCVRFLNRPIGGSLPGLVKLWISFRAHVFHLVMGSTNILCMTKSRRYMNVAATLVAATRGCPRSGRGTSIFGWVAVFGPHADTKSIPNIPDRTSDNLKSQSHELQPHPQITECIFRMSEVGVNH